MTGNKIHAYAASFGDDFAGHLIDKFTCQGDILADPFAGAGTSLIQARLLHRSAIGIDVDPIACLISRVLTTPYSLDELDTLDRQITTSLTTIESEIRAVQFDKSEFAPGTTFSLNGYTGAIPDKSEIEFWFSPTQRALLALLVHLARECTDPRIQDVVELAISSSIIRKWPNTISQARDIDHSRPHRVIRDTITFDSQLRIFRRAFSRCLGILRGISSSCSEGAVRSTIIEGDSESVLLKMEPDSVDYVLTSPPYFSAIDYPRSHKFSQWWLKPDEPLHRNSYIGIRSAGRDDKITEVGSTLMAESLVKVSSLAESEKTKFNALCRYVVDLNNVIGGIKHVLKPGKSLTLILANNEVGGVIIPVDAIVEHLLEANNFGGIHSEVRDIKVGRRRYPFGIKGFRGPMTAETVIHAVKSTGPQPNRRR